MRASIRWTGVGLTFALIASACGTQATSVQGTESPSPSPSAPATTSPTPEATEPSPTPGKPAPSAPKKTTPQTEPPEFCETQPGSADAMLMAYFKGSRRDPDAIWPYREAIAAMKRSGVEVSSMLPRDSTQWRGFARVGGTIETLAPAAKRLRTEESGPYTAPDVGIACNKDPELTGTFNILLPEGVDIEEVVRRHGNKETIEGNSLKTWWGLRPRDERLVVTRALDYFPDPDVLLVEVSFVRYPLAPT